MERDRASGNTMLAHPPETHANAHESNAATDSRDARRVLLLSNGHGEDLIGSQLASALRRHGGEHVAVVAWPLVGRGDAYTRAGIACIGSRNELPGEGFGTLSLRAFAGDLKAGWLGVHAKQARDAMRLRHRFDLAVVVGDVVPMIAATLARTPFVVVGCAKSVYYGPRFGFNVLERWLMKRAGALCFARDAITAQQLVLAGVNARWVGNPVMDGLEPTGARFDCRGGEVVIACFPGSRSDRERNGAAILRLVAAARSQWEALGRVHLAFALPAEFDVKRMASLLGDGQRTRSTWTFVSGPLDHAYCGGLRATFTYGALGEILVRSRAAIGLGGTVNEQAVGRGVPCVTFATEGVQGAAYLRMKMPYYGAAVLEVPARPVELAAAVARVATDITLRERMLRAGWERMGRPGATDAIVTEIARQLE